MERIYCDSLNLYKLGCIGQNKTSVYIFGPHLHVLNVYKIAMQSYIQASCKSGKIHWAKHLRFQPYEVFAEILS